MPIVVNCGCGKKVRVADAMAGRQVKCPACNSPLSVPLPGMGALVDTTEDVEEKPAEIPTAVSAVRELLSRIERLRARQRYVTIAGIVVAAALSASCVALAVALHSRPEPIRPLPNSKARVIQADGGGFGFLAVKKLALIDDQGTVRAELSTGEGEEAGLKFFSKGKVRGEFRVWGNGIPSLLINDENEQLRICVGGGSESGIDFYDKDGNQLASMSTWDTENTFNMSLSAHDASGRFQLGIHKDGSLYFDLFDKEDQHIPLVDKDGKPLFPLRPGE